MKAYHILGRSVVMAALVLQGACSDSESGQKGGGGTGPIIDCEGLNPEECPECATEVHSRYQVSAADVSAIVDGDWTGHFPGSSVAGGFDMSLSVEVVGTAEPGYSYPDPVGFDQEPTLTDADWEKCARVDFPANITVSAPDADPTYSTPEGEEFGWVSVFSFELNGSLEEVGDWWPQPRGVVLLGGNFDTMIHDYPIEYWYAFLDDGTMWMSIEQERDIDFQEAGTKQ